MQSIDILQIGVHAPMMQIDVPPNALKFYEFIFPIINFDVLEEVQPYQDLLEETFASEIENTKPLISDQTMALGYDSRNPFVNQGTMTLVLLVLMIKIMLMPLLWVVGCK